MLLRLISLPTNKTINPFSSTLRHFHRTTAWSSEIIDHYQALGLEPNASATAIKKSLTPLFPPLIISLICLLTDQGGGGRQFYTLSKTHHPDHNPNDPSASDRFVKISEAYAVLGSPEKRQKYDRDNTRGGAATGPRTSTRRGSHSSSTYGARPASGLSKRRTQFRGPPPSFYKNGGWGSQGTKRQSQADAGASPGAAGTTTEGGFGGGGYGPGQAQAGWDVPHFDREAHLRTQEQQERRWMLRRRTGGEDADYSGAGMLIQFLLVGGVISMALMLPLLFERDGERKHKHEP